MDFDTQRKSNKVIAVDFDGTIVEHRFPEIGTGSSGALMYLRKWRAMGIKLILWTMRDKDYLEDAVRWCKERGLEFDAINEGIGDGEWTTSNKAYADVYIDDMAIGCPMLDYCRMVDWSKVGPMVEKRLRMEDKMISDTEMLDWLEVQLQKGEYTGKCIFRWSNNGRGFRLHETSLDGAVDTVRKAITNAILEKRHDNSGES